ncbi:beta-glucosidase BglX [Oryzibacter oryziterrae]|uniref:beta-glucosidase BglX n=1 Tax=Oryzibacter oryziterrae TaxID=2766474 RepID=UPI001F013F0D|nr:beta-glucosidase BglX [Oryzibacter oryziterrae]
MSKEKSDVEIKAFVDELMGKMTLEEKAGQITQYFNFLRVPEESRRVEAELAAGRCGSMLFVPNAEDINRLQKIAVEQTRLGIPLLFGYDVIHGLRTAMPVPIAVAASWDPDLAEEGQSVAAAEARAVGLHWSFAPMVDIARDPRWGRIIEGAGEDPYLGAAMAAAQVRGFQGAYVGAPDHVISGPKHFAGYGAAIGGRDYDEANISDNELWNVYLPPFKAAIDAGAYNIMSAYMGLNGVPATGNKWLLSDVLRDTWGFKGFVVTDAGAAYDLCTHGYAADVADAGLRALDAGVDLEMAPPFGESAYRTLPQSVAEGKVSEADIDIAVRRVLEAKVRMGLFDNPYVDVKEAEAVLTRPAHRDTARRAAERSAVLLRNDGDLLPLPRDLASIAVIGPLADSARDTVGPWIFEQDDSETVTVLAGIRAKVGAATRVDYAQGVTLPGRYFKSIFENDEHKQTPRPIVDDTIGIQRAVDLARKSDVVVLVLGEGQVQIGEHASRSSLDLPGRQQELMDAVIGTGKPVVLLLMAARPLDLKGSYTRALMGIWYPGSQGGAAVANLLFGDAVPGGKLPYTWPRNIGQIPLHYAQLKSHKPDWAAERYWNEPNSPLYPFGYGLSYARFSYANLRLSASAIAPGATLTVSVDVTNSGKVGADEVVQLYIHQRHGSSARPVRLLKGFRRIPLAAGETQTVSFPLGPDELSHWSAASRSVVLDATTFDVFVGGDSTADLTASFDVRKG